MIKTTPGNLWDELRSGKDYVRARLQSREKLVSQYHGSAWFESNGDDAGIENHPYEYISLILPQIVYSNPRVTVQSMRTTPVHRMVASALQQGLNRWIEDSALADMLRQLCFDYLTSWGVALITFEENTRVRLPKSMRSRKGFDYPMWPVVTRLSPEDFFFDPQATDPQSCRWQAHRRLWDLDDLLKVAEANEDGTWDASVVRELEADSRSEQRAGRTDGPDREQVWVYEMWLPEDADSNGKNEHGRIYTLVEALSGGGDDEPKAFVREPRDYYGPFTGPYAVFGAFPVSDQPGYVAPLVATLKAQQEAEAFSMAFSESAKNFKSEFITSNKKLAEIMQNSPHQHIHHAEGTLFDALGKPVFAEVKYGGASREQAEGVLQARERVERMTGMSDAMRGQTSGSRTTATEEQIAFQGGSIRVDDLRERFTRRLVQMIKSVAWYMYTDDEFVIPIGGTEFGQHDAWFEGGEDSGLVKLIDMSYYDLEMVIEPYSMERITDSARMARLGAAAERAILIGQAMPQMPWLNWHEIVQDIGNAYNLPDYSSRFNWQALQAIWSQGGMPMQPPSGLGEAKLAKHAPPQSQSASFRSPVEMTESPNGRSAGRRAQAGAPQTP